MKKLETNKDLPEAAINDFEAYTVEEGERIDLRKWEVTSQLMPIACFVKPDGAIGDRPSLCFVVVGNGEAQAVQISLAMFEPILKELDQYRK